MQISLSATGWSYRYIHAHDTWQSRQGPPASNKFKRLIWAVIQTAWLPCRSIPPHSHIVSRSQKQHALTTSYIYIYKTKSKKNDMFLFAVYIHIDRSTFLHAYMHVIIYIYICIHIIHTCVYTYMRIIHEKIDSPPCFK